MTECHIDLFSGRKSFTLNQAGNAPITSGTANTPLLMYGVGPVKPEVLEGQRNDQNGAYVDSLIAYFKEMEEREEDQKHWASFYVEMRKDKVLHSVHFSSDFVKKICTFFPFCKYQGGAKPLNRLRLRLHGSFQVQKGSWYESFGRRPGKLQFQKEFDLMGTNFEGKGYSMKRVFHDSITTEMDDSHCNDTKKSIESIIHISIDWFEMSTIEATSQSSMINRLFNHEESKDFTLVSGNGVEMKCHKNILMIQSEMAAAMLSPDKEGMLEHQSGKLEMGEMSDDGLKKFIQLLYGQTVTISDMKCDVVLEIFRYCHLYGMKELLDTLVTLLLQRNYLWYTANSLVEIYILLKRADFREDLRKYLLCCMSMMKSKIRNCERYKELSREDSNDLVWRLHENSI